MIIITLTTIPPRLPHLYITIDSLLSQTILPDLIIINIPIKYNNYGNDFALPDCLNNARIYINRCIDYGPGTKLLGIYNSDIYNNMNDDDIIIAVDDDRTYNNKLIEHFLYYHDKYPDYALTAAGWDITEITDGKITCNKKKTNDNQFHELLGETLF
jgi:hypothetical protein